MILWVRSRGKKRRIMDNCYHYIGCFLPKDQLARYVEKVSTGHLVRIIGTPHVTFLFEPDHVNEKLFGEKVWIKVIGYGNNGANEGLLVNIYAENKEILSMVEKIKVPHITLSIAENSRSYDTRYLDFYNIDPFMLEGIFGGYRRDGKLVLFKDKL